MGAASGLVSGFSESGDYSNLALLLLCGALGTWGRREGRLPASAKPNHCASSLRALGVAARPSQCLAARTGKYEKNTAFESFGI